MITQFENELSEEYRRAVSDGSITITTLTFGSSINKTDDEHQLEQANLILKCINDPSISSTLCCSFLGATKLDNSALINMSFATKGEQTSDILYNFLLGVLDNFPEEFSLRQPKRETDSRLSSRKVTFFL